ncbi:synthase III [Hibiscus syriacus]|uniref:Synthase III n=1 Tax=Hibiscus syriacus TaxID=106335 RepID=A0A6A3C2I2_HIBSY|nr:synthase III [Hibiscus syriacus]
MANASGFFTPSVPKLRTKVQPSIGISGSGFGFSRRVVCSSAIEGAEKHVSPLESRVPKLVSKGCKLVGCGSAVLSLSVSNDDLSKIVDTNDEWISVRTGIRNRRANQRIIDAVAARLEFPQEKVISNLANYGNTSAASIPLALDEAVRSGNVKSGHTIATAGFAPGLTWGSAVIRWG